MIKVSVIIPCYNVELYLEQCLGSALSQSLRDIEVICVDDGSTDSTPEILRDYEKKDPRIRVLSQKNQFAGVARNVGMALAQGEYIAFLDGDDYYIPGSLEKAYATAKEHDLDMLKLSSYLLDQATGELSTTELYLQAKVETKYQVISFKDHWKQVLRCRDVPWNGLYKRSFLEQNHIQFSDLRCTNDHSFFIHCAIAAQRTMVTDDFLAVYRQNVGGSLVAVRHRYFDCQLRNYKIVREIVNAAQLPEDIRRQLMQRELELIFIWYQKFLQSGVNVFPAEEALRSFFATYDVADVGEHFLSVFRFKHYYNRLMKSLGISWQKGGQLNLPRVSVIIPVHNSVRYLSECLESILLQSLRNFEIICVNDGSTDASLELLEDFARKDGRIRVVSQEQSGAGSARNRGIAKAIGTYLTFVDSDDKIDESFLQNLVTGAEEHSADVVVTNYLLWTGGKVRTLQNRAALHIIPENRVFSYRDYPDEILCFTNGGVGGKLFKRSFVVQKRLEFLPFRHSEDFYFVDRAIVMAERIVFSKKDGYYYRQDNMSSAENTKDTAPLLFWEACLLLLEELKKLESYEQIKRAILGSFLGRVDYNLQTVKTPEGFREILLKLRNICWDVLEMKEHDREYYKRDTAYDHIFPLLQFETELEALMHLLNQKELEIEGLRTELNFGRREKREEETRGVEDPSRMLDEVFLRYEELLRSGKNPFGAEEALQTFVTTYDPSTVGEKYLEEFDFAHHFKRFEKRAQIRWQTRNTGRKPKISVILPVYNGISYLSVCLESILLQSFRDFELICVDDGSTDSTPALLQEFAKRDARIRVLQQANTGSGVARNYAISQAKGKYLAFVDADDAILPDYLKQLYIAARKKRAQIVVTSFTVWDGVHRGIPVSNVFADNIIPHNKPFSYRDVPRYIFNFCNGMPGGKMVRRDFVEERNLQFMPTKRFVDFPFTHGAIAMADRVVYTPVGGYLYRKNHGNSLQNTKDQTPLLFWEVSMAFKDRLQKLEYYDTIKSSYLSCVLRKVDHNLKTMKTPDGFRTVFQKLPELCYGELEMKEQSGSYYTEVQIYDSVSAFLQFKTAEEAMFSILRTRNKDIYRLKQDIFNKNKGKKTATPSLRPQMGRMKSYLLYLQEQGFKATVHYGLHKIKTKISGFLK